MELRGRAVLVTGATGALGRAIATRLLAEGAVLTLTGRQADALHPLAEELAARAIVADPADRADLQRVADECGDVDVLVANADLPGTGELTDYSVEDLDRVLDVNLRAPVLLTRLLGAAMLKRGEGHVVLISSLSGKTAVPATSLFTAAKFGLRGFALGLRQDWAPLGVGVSCVNPGPVEEAEPADGAALPAGFRPRVPDDVAAAVVRAIRHDKAEIDVADPVKKAGVVFGQFAPQLAARLNRFADTEGATDQR
jgi:short-subunit dehydrogenase